MSQTRRQAVAVAGDSGSGLRECDGDSCAEATGRTGDEGDFIVKAEAVKDVGWRVGHG